MLGNTKLLVSALLAVGLAAGCGDNLDAPPDGAPQPPPPPPPAGDPTDPAGFTTPQGEKLAFGVKEGNIRNYFHRQGPAAVHLLTRSGAEPRIIAAYPAGNQGIGIWFDADIDNAQLWAGATAQPTDDAAVTAGGGVTAVVREESGEKDMNGVRATIQSDAKRLTGYLTLLANVRTLRDYGYGRCLENANEYPEFRNETIEYFEEYNVVRVRRAQIGGEYAMEILIKGGAGTTLAVKEQEFAARASCQPTADDAMEKVIEISGESGVAFDLIVLGNDEPLTPIDKADLLTQTPPDSFELNALAFLSYAEKLQAGSWRFLTYFGRDTLLSVRMLMPGLKRAVVEAALTSVIERIKLEAGVNDPNFDFEIEVGDVAHEEELADFAAWLNDMLDPKPEDVRAPRYDYKMIDDDFLLAPVLVEYMAKVRAEITDPAEAQAAIDAFLARTRTDGVTFKAAIEANLKLVLDRARPFAEDDGAPATKVTKLVSLKENVPVGQWRDSDLGIAFGRFAFDVNAGLVPGALEAAQALYMELENTESATDAGALLAEWQGIDELFLIEAPLVEVQANVTAYATLTGVDNTADQLESEQGNQYSYYGIALDGAGEPLPVMHTDHGFVMEFTNPSEEYLTRVAETISNDFPAGLMSSVGVMVANPALASADLMLTNPRDLRNPADDVQVTLQSIFTNSHYHGAVVWSWQQALLASGIRRQIERTGLQPATLNALKDAECKLWETIDAAESVRAGELWSWEANAEGELEYRPFGYNLTDVDESNAAQLWSTVYLVVKKPTPAQNDACAAAAR
jgi:hypothetical protein